MRNVVLSIILSGVLLGACGSPASREGAENTPVTADTGGPFSAALVGQPQAIPPKHKDIDHLPEPVSPKINILVDEVLFSKLAAELTTLDSTRADNTPRDNLSKAKTLINALPKAAAPDSVVMGYAKTLLAQFEYDAGHYDKALEAFYQALDIYASNNYTPSKASLEIQMDLPNVLDSLGRKDEAQIAFESAETAVLDFYGSPSTAYGKLLCEKGFRYYYQNQHKTAAQTLEQGVAMLRPRMDWEDTNAVSEFIAYMSSLSSIYTEIGDKSRALEANETAMQLAVTHLPEKNVMRANVLHNYGGVMNANGRYAEGANVLRRALNIHREVSGKDHMMTVYSIYNLAVSEGMLGNYKVSEDLLLEAHELFLSMGEGQEQPAYLTLNNAARMSVAQGQQSLAIARFETAVDGIAKSAGADNATLVVPLQNLATQYYLAGKTEKALNSLREAGRIIKLHHAPSNPVALLNDMLTAIIKDNSAAAKIVFETAIEEVVKAINNTDTANKPSAFTPVFEPYAIYRLENNDMQTAIEAVQYARINSLSEIGHARDARQNSDIKSAAKLRERQDLIRQVSRADEAYKSAVASNDSARIFRAKSALDAVQKSWDAFESDYSDTLDSSLLFPSLSRLQSRLSPTDGIIITFQSAIFPKTILITRDEVIASDFNRSPLALNDTVAKIRDSLKSPDFDFDVAAAHALYKDIFPPDMTQAISTLDHLYIAPEKGLTQIPFALLISDVSSNLVYMNDNFALTTLPSIGALQAQKSKAAHKNKFLGIGAPALSGPEPGVQMLASNQAFFRDGRGNVKAVEDLPPLPNASRELNALATEFGARRATLLTGLDATEANFSRLDHRVYDVIAFSTHGLVSGTFDGQDEAALIMTPPNDGTGAISANNDGVLTQSEIAKLRLNSDWVILSACNTAAGSARSATGLTGLASAFLYAGANSLLVSHWPVRDDAAAFLTVETVKNTKDGMSKAKALQKAINDLKDNKPFPNADHPAIWAPFVLVSRG